MIGVKPGRWIQPLKKTATKHKKRIKGSSNDNRPGHSKDIDWNISTWNVTSLLRTGAKEELLNVLSSYKVDIAVVQEIRWKGSGIQTIRNSKEKADFYYSGTQFRKSA